MKDFDKYEAKGAYHFDWYNDPNWVWYKECVDRCVKFCKGPTVDVGCGDGVVSKLISDKGHRVIGIDNDKTAIALAVKNVPNANFFCAGIEEVAFMPIEYLACLNVIEHLKSIEPLLSLLRSPLIKKGAIIITDKATDEPGRYHEHEYTKEELIDTFKEFKPKYFEINSTEFGKPITFIGVEILK